MQNASKQGMWGIRMSKRERGGGTEIDNKKDYWHI